MADAGKYMSLNILFSSRWGQFWPKRFKIGLFLKQIYKVFGGFFETEILGGYLDIF